MIWYHYIVYFFAGALITNSIPHWVSGLMGRKFPTPFAVPPGVGESSPKLNIIWGLGNFFVGYLLLQIGSFSITAGLAAVPFFIGLVVMSLMLAKHFGSTYSPFK